MSISIPNHIFPGILFLDLKQTLPLLLMRWIWFCSVQHKFLIVHEYMKFHGWYGNILLNFQYAKFVKPAFDDFILPTKKYADIIIPRGGDNHVAIDLIVQHIRTKLGQHNLCKIYPNLNVIQSTFQVIFILLSFPPPKLSHLFCSKSLMLSSKVGAFLQTRGMHTLIRDKEISKHDFVFYSDRLIRLVGNTLYKIIWFTALSKEN
jgi:hypothetical protein